MTAGLRDECRDETCRLLRLVPPDAPTLCEGWTAYDLAVHLWGLNHSVVQPVLEALERERAAGSHRSRIKKRLPYDDLINELSEGPASFRWMPFDSRENHRHALGEWYIHGEDVRRANGLPPGNPRPALQDALWERLKVAAPMLRRRERINFQSPSGEVFASGKRGPNSTVAGEPAELLLWAYGRNVEAHVEVR